MNNKKTRVRLARTIRKETGLKLPDAMRIARIVVRQDNGYAVPEGTPNTIAYVDGWDMSGAERLSAPYATGPRGDCHLHGALLALRA